MRRFIVRDKNRYTKVYIRPGKAEKLKAKYGVLPCYYVAEETFFTFTDLDPLSRPFSEDERCVNVFPRRKEPVFTVALMDREKCLAFMQGNDRLKDLKPNKTTMKMISRMYLREMLNL